jgi:hypothetical protein
MPKTSIKVRPPGKRSVSKSAETAAMEAAEKLATAVPGEREPIEAPKASSAKRTQRSRRASPGERVAVYLDPDLAEALRMHAAKTRSTVSLIVEIALKRAAETGLPDPRSEE